MSMPWVETIKEFVKNIFCKSERSSADRRYHVSLKKDQSRKTSIGSNNIKYIDKHVENHSNSYFNDSEKRENIEDDNKNIREDFDRNEYFKIIGSMSYEKLSHYLDVICNRGVWSDADLDELQKFSRILEGDVTDEMYDEKLQEYRTAVIVSFSEFWILLGNHGYSIDNRPGFYTWRIHNQYINLRTVQSILFDKASVVLENYRNFISYAKNEKLFC